MNLEALRHTHNFFDYPDFYTWVAQQDFKILVEVGVWKGHSISFLANLLRNKPGIKIYAVDLFEKMAVGFSGPIPPDYVEEVNNLDKIYNLNLTATNTRHLIVDITDFSDKAAAKFDNNSVDFAFIDADHAYEPVKKDILAWLPKIGKGRILAGHDYGWPGVTKAVNEILGGKFKIFSGSVWYIRP